MTAMMRTLLPAALLALLAACGGNAPPAPDAQRELTAQADAWDKAIIARDVPAIEANMAADFQQIRKGGAVAGREEFLRDITDPKLTIAPYKVEDFSIRQYGDVALLAGRIRMEGGYEGKPWTSHFRYIDVYVREKGRWKVASVQITPMNP